MEQYIALIPDDIKPGIVNPKIGDDVEFEINTNFMRELRRKLFAGTDGKDAYEHVRTVLEIVDLFHFPGVTHIYCHPFITAKKLEEIHNFKQERDETLYYVWERYNDLLYQCPLHDLNCQKKVHIFYTGLDICTRKILDSNGFIPLMTPTQALESIQVMADHSHNWYDETTTRERINDVLDNVDATHESFKGEHLTKECSLKKENEAIKHSRYMESLEETIEKAYQLTHKVLTNTREKVKAIMTMGKENMKEPVPRDLSPTPFLGHLKEQMGSPYRTRETVRIIGNPEEIHNAKAQEEEGDMDVSWDITSKDVERLRQFLTPTIHTLPNLEPVVQPYIPLGPVHDKDKIVREKEQDYDIPLNDSVMQPLTPQTVHITPPDDDYVAPATNPMSNKQLNKFEEEFSHITEVAEKEYDNPVIKTYDCETFIRKLLHQLRHVHNLTKSSKKISAFVDSRLKSIERFLNCFADQPNETNINNPESDDGLADTPLISPFPHSDNDSDDEEVLNELSEYENAGTLHRERITH
ncbi:hypothetical protein Tco_0870040 [Tanacetum coccineum]